MKSPPFFAPDLKYLLTSIENGCVRLADMVSWLASLLWGEAFLSIHTIDPQKPLSRAKNTGRRILKTE